MTRTQFSLPIKVLRSDNGGEYVNNELSQCFQEQGILHETTCPQTQQNGVAEHKNRYILETARAILIGASTPQYYWADTVTYVVYLMNRMPSRVLDFCTTMEALALHVSLSSTLQLFSRIFGCVAYVHLHKN